MRGLSGEKDNKKEKEVPSTGYYPLPPGAQKENVLSVMMVRVGGEMIGQSRIYYSIIIHSIVQ